VKVDPVEVADLMLKSGLKPLATYPGKDKKWKCRCLTCGNQVLPTWNSIRNGAGGCSKCRYIKSANSNRTPQKDAIQFILKRELIPLEPYFNKDTPWKCRCLICKNTVYPRLGNIKKGQGGCGFCRESGLNYEEKSYIYLIYHENFQSLKVGVSNIDSKPNRIKAHEKQGWQVFKVLNFATGRDAELVETKILKWIRRDLGIMPHLNAKLMPQGGHTETADLNEIDISRVWKRIQAESRRLK
jgi:hypothetical protein